MALRKCACMTLSHLQNEFFADLITFKASLLIDPCHIFFFPQENTASDSKIEFSECNFDLFTLILGGNMNIIHLLELM